jgi:hypothetical protein
MKKSIIKLSKKYSKVFLGIIAVVFAINCSKHSSDFSVFLDAGRRILIGENIYAQPFYQGLQYYYSPLFALILSPLSKLPVFIPQFIWICFDYYFLYRIWAISLEYFDTSKLTIKQKYIWAIAVSLLSFRFVRHDMAVVQMTIFLLWATLQSMQFFNQNRNFSGAALLAMAINIKLLPLAFVIYLLYRNKFKGATLTALFYIVYLYLPAIFLGWERNEYLVKAWFTTINPLSKQWTIETDDGPSSLVAMVPVYITKTIGKLSLKRNLLNLKYEQVFIILNTVRIIFVVLALAFLKTRPFKTIGSGMRQYWEMCYFFIIIPLIYPHQQQYAFVYIMPAFIYITWYFIENWHYIKPRMNFLKWLFLVVVGINFTPIIGRDIITNYLFEVLLYYRVLTIATVLLIPVLWRCQHWDHKAALE